MMKRRPFGKLQVPVSPFGMGMMRLPTGPDGNPDEAEVARMVRAAVDQGVNYFDTAFGYHGGKSEIALGKALEGGLRDQVYIATKLPRWNVKKAEDMMPIFEEQLQKLKTDHIDFYLLHAIDGPSFEELRGYGVLDFLTELKAAGKIRYAGFSYHDDFATLGPILDSYDWDFVQVQFNYMDVEDSAGGLSAIRLLGERNIPVVVMEPLLGGKLATPPAEVLDLFAGLGAKRAPVDWAFRWILNHPEIAVVLSGVSNMQQLQEDIDIFRDLDAGCLTPSEAAAFEQVRETYLKRIAVPCTGCAYCKPCPANVNIPELFSLWNDFTKFSTIGGDRWRYNSIVDAKAGPDQCVGCNQCMEKCPQSFDIPEQLRAFSDYMKS